jgi:ribonuclease HII
LAGPVFAAAVILPPDFVCGGLNDSKQLSERQREELRPVIEREAMAWGVGVVSAQEIDAMNILRASMLAMHRALDQLIIRPEFLLIDGNHFYRYEQIPFATIVKGDGKYQSIAAASILAKTHRDAYMTGLHNEFPNYDWKRNKGYPTARHRKAIEEYGITGYHRRSFALLGGDGGQMRVF